MVDEEMSILDAVTQTAQQMRVAYQLPEISLILARWKRDVWIERYGLEEVEAGEKRWNIQWVDDWTEVSEL